MVVGRMLVVIVCLLAGLTSHAAQDNPDAAKRIKEAKALYERGEIDRAEAIISELAPDDKPGFDLAHFLRAQKLATEVAKESNKDSLTKLRWHLEHSPTDGSVDVGKFWAVYFVTSGQPKQAVPYLERASIIDPRLHLSLANLYAQIGSKTSELRALNQAEVQFRRLLKDDPLSMRDRLQLAATLVRLDRPDDAEEVLLNGVKLHNNEEMRQAVVQYYLLQCDTKRKESPRDFYTQIGLLEKGLQHTPDNGVLLERLADLYDKIGKPDVAKMHREKTNKKQ